jgi:hypothetical protein
MLRKKTEALEANDGTLPQGMPEACRWIGVGGGHEDIVHDAFRGNEAFGRAMAALRDLGVRDVIWTSRSDVEGAWFDCFDVRRADGRPVSITYRQNVRAIVRDLNDLLVDAMPAFLAAWEVLPSGSHLDEHVLVCSVSASAEKGTLEVFNCSVHEQTSEWMPNVIFR